MKVSVIIGSYRPGKCLNRCIKSLLRQTVLPDEIIIGVDSIIGHRYITNSAEVPCKFVPSGKTGVSAARNAACKEAIGDIYAFIDDDATADPDWIERIRNLFEYPFISCVGGSVIPVFERGTIPEQWYWIVGCTGISNRPICSNMAIRKGIFESQGGFPENLGRIKRNFAIGEETELVINLEKAHRTVVYEPDLTVHHWCPDYRTRLPYIVSRAYQEGVGKAISFKKHRSLGYEQSFLKHYLTHPDRYTIPVLCSVGLGFLYGRLWG